MSARGRDVTRYLRDVDRTLRKITDPIEAAPFVAWLKAEIEQLERSTDPVNAAARALARIGWDDDAGKRRWHRWRFEVMVTSRVVDRAAIEEALTEAGMAVGDLYPEDATEVELRPDAWCGACAERVTPLLVGDVEQCPWCDGPVKRFAIPRLRLAPTPPEPAPAWTTTHRPRIPGLPPRPVYLDVMLGERRRALAVFVETGEWKAAARAIRPGVFASVDSAQGALRNLAMREGWLEGGRGHEDWQQRRDAAREAVRRALDDGTWSRVVEQCEIHISRDMLADHLIHEAAWLYFYDGLSFGDVARRLLPLTRYAGERSLAKALHGEWDIRGWPRRSLSASAAWKPPTGRGQCAAIGRSGARCARWATKGQRFCFDHDPASRHAARARNLAASQARNADAVTLGPWRAWLLGKALPEAGSMQAVHRRVGDVISYGTLTDWTKRYARNGPSKANSVRRSTIERILAAWGDGTTFEDIYVPEPADQAAAG